MDGRAESCGGGQAAAVEGGASRRPLPPPPSGQVQIQKSAAAAAAGTSSGLQLLHLAGSLVSLQPVNPAFKGAAPPSLLTPRLPVKDVQRFNKEPLNVPQPPANDQ